MKKYHIRVNSEKGYYGFYVIIASHAGKAEREAKQQFAADYGAPIKELSTYNFNPDNEHLVEMAKEALRNEG